LYSFCRFFFFNDTSTSQIYTLSLHDALPISQTSLHRRSFVMDPVAAKYIGAGIACLGMGGAGIGVGTIFSQFLNGALRNPSAAQDRKSTRLNSSHLVISYAVFCLKKKIQ